MGRINRPFISLPRSAAEAAGNSEDSKLITGNVFKNTKELNMAMMEQRKRLMIQKTQEVKFEEVKEGETDD